MQNHPQTKRFFCKNKEPVQHRGKTYVLSNQWAKETLNLVSRLDNEFPNHNIKVSEADPELNMEGVNEKNG